MPVQTERRPNSEGTPKQIDVIPSTAGRCYSQKSRFGYCFGRDRGPETILTVK